jgi:serine/threonine protein kinase
VSYLPFFYTLEKEIVTRRQKSSLFREQELWKLITYLCKGVAEWMEVYSQEKLGVICPSNIVMNPQGQVKLVCKLSFFLQVFGSFHEYYMPPESRGSSLIKYALNPHRDPYAVEASLIYSIGAIILEAATLTLSDLDSFSREQKELTFRNLNYSGELKDAVLGMVEPNQMSRHRLTYLLKVAKANRNKH